jgi:hypothetical protein
MFVTWSCVVPVDSRDSETGFGVEINSGLLNTVSIREGEGEE